MALIDDLNLVSTKLSQDATILEALVPGLQTQVSSQQSQIVSLQAQVLDFQNQLAAGLSASQGAAILAALNAVELRFKALIP